MSRFPLVGLMVPEHTVRACRALQSVGDLTLGQWVEVGERAVHVRRRLSPAEANSTGLVVRDIRGTSEADERLAYVRTLIPDYAE